MNTIPNDKSKRALVQAVVIFAAAAWGCERAPEDDLPRILLACQSAEMEDRYEAVRELSYLTDRPTEVVPLLTGMLKDRDPAVRMVAAYKLLNFGDAAAPAVPALVEALQKDSDAEVRVAAAISLSEMGKAGVPALPALRLATYDRSPEVRAEATLAIKHLEIAAKYSRPRKPAQEVKKKAKI